MSELRWVGLLLGLGLLQVFLPQVWAPLGAVDLLLIAVAHQALRAPFRRSVLFGAGAGLIQDGLSGGLVGLHGFAKTVISAIIASFGSFLVVRGSVPQATIAAAASLLEGLIVVGWLVLLERPASAGAINVPTRALATGIATLAFLVVVRRLGRQRRRRASPFTRQGARS